MASRCSPLEAFTPGILRPESRCPSEYPVSSWADCESALEAASEAAATLRNLPPEAISRFLNRFAERLEARSAELVEQAHLETALPASPRLADVELPRTINQLRQAADAALDGSWALPTIDTKLNIRSVLAPIGPVAVFGPNNFPFAFNGAAGGDFAAAVAAGNPVIAKGHPLHAGTSRMLAEEAFAAVCEAGLPRATVQLLYRIKPESGSRLVADRRIGATAFTGSRSGGLALKAAADRAGKPIYLEMSSVNPVVILPGALAERGAKVAEEFAGSCLVGRRAVLHESRACHPDGRATALKSSSMPRRQKFESSVAPPLLSADVAQSLAESVQVLQESGAATVTAAGK